MTPVHRIGDHSVGICPEIAELTCHPLAGAPQQSELHRRSAQLREHALARTGKRFGLNAMSAIATTGKLYFTIFPGRFDASTCIAFFAKLIAHFQGQKIHLVLDRHSVHRSKAVREWVAAHAESIELHFLPAYAPHLNPDELVNADLKCQLADRVITSREQLVAETRSVLPSIQKLPARIIGYFHAPHTGYTLTPASP